MTHDELRELIARAIYEDMPYDGIGEKPAWVPRGNAIKQDEARCKADAILSALDKAGMVVVPKESTQQMQCAGGEAQSRSIGSWDEPAIVYRAMIAAWNENGNV